VKCPALPFRGLGTQIDSNITSGRHPKDAGYIKAVRGYILLGPKEALGARRSKETSKEQLIIPQISKTGAD